MQITYISYNGILEPLSQSQVIPYLRGLAAKGFNFDLVSFERKKDLADKGRVATLSAELKGAHIAWHRLAYHKKPAILSTIYDIFIGTAYCAYLALRKRKIILHARSYAPAVMAYILNKLFGVRFIFDMRGMMVDEYEEGGIIKKGGLVSKIGRLMEKKIILSSAGVVVLTERIKGIIEGFDYLRTKRRVDIRIIPCCVDLRKFSYNPPASGLADELCLNGKIVFLYIGSVGTWYFLDGMIDLFAVAKRRIPGAHFLILSREDKHFIRDSVSARGLNPTDFTVTEDRHENMPRYISISKVGVIFYRQAFSRLACSPVKFAEYLACGIPIIINSGVGDTEELVRVSRIGAVVKEFTKNGYESAVDDIMELAKEGEALRRRCRDTAEKIFSLARGIDKYAALYQEIGR